MNVDPDTLLYLKDVVDRIGGAALEEPHIATHIKDLDRSGQMQASTSGCGKQARFALPYEVVDAGDWKAPDMVKRGAGIVIACAEDDMMADWPRIKDGSKEYA